MASVRKKGNARVALIGLDGFSPVWMDRFLSARELPAIAALGRGGTRTPLVSTLPATTPVAWAAVATGCSPAANGVEGFLIHRPGQPLDQRTAGIYADRCRAEPLWETAAISGRRSFVVKFPLSYPSPLPALRIDGAAGWGGLRCLHEMAPSAVARAGDRQDEMGLRETREEWRGSPPAAQTVIWSGRWHLHSLWDKATKLSLYVSLTRAAGQAPLVHVANVPDWNRVLATLGQGEWSRPITVRARGRQGVDDFSFRVKVLTCEPSPLNLTLFNTPVHELRGHSAPSYFWDHYLDLAGPIEEQCEPDHFLNGAIDLDTQLELFRINAEWLTDISTRILAGEDWDLFMVQAHYLDWAHHMLEGMVDPRHPDYDANSAHHYQAALLETYRLADQMVAAIREAAGPDADLLVLGDHGQDLNHTFFRTNAWLARQGLLAWTNHGAAVDWSHTRAYATGNYLYLNVKDREPQGLVDPREVPALIAELIEGLLSLTDPRTGQRPILLAAPKAHFEFLGGHGVGVGDIVFCCRSGYQARNDRAEVFAPTRALRDFTSGHDHFWPLDPCLYTTLFASGPAIREGFVRQQPYHLQDVYPTICAIMGLEPSPGCEGRTMVEVLAY